VSDSALPTSSPSAEGVDARGIAALVDALEARPDVEPHGLTIARHGREIASGHWGPYRRDAPRLLYSLSKSFTSTAVGFAVDEGLLGLDDFVIDHFPEYADDAADDRVRSWRVRHLLTMGTGHTSDTQAQIFGRDEDPVRLFLRLAPEREPGTVFSYNQGCTYTAGAIVQRRAGCTLPEYLQPRLFDIVGGGPVSWLEQPPGRSLGFSGLHATHDDVVRLGQLYLQRGRWGSSSVLPSTWVDLATSSRIATSPPETNPDWAQGYGFQFWMARHGYRGDGAYGQFCIVLPEQDAVVVITSATPVMQAVVDDVYEHLLPAFDGVPSSAEDASLAARLDGLTLPLPTGAASPRDSALWDGLSFVPAGGVCSAQSSLTAVRVSRSIGEDPWQLTLVENDASFTVSLRSSWTPAVAAVSPGADTIPVAAAGAFTDSGELRAEIRFLDTPHTVLLTLDPAALTFDASWPTVPLHEPPLHQLHAPR
jgi:CubicO group peptidase (beta-lactamase class C family)